MNGWADDSTGVQSTQPRAKSRMVGFDPKSANSRTRRLHGGAHRVQKATSHLRLSTPSIAFLFFVFAFFFPSSPSLLFEVPPTPPTPTPPPRLLAAVAVSPSPPDLSSPTPSVGRLANDCEVGVVRFDTASPPGRIQSLNNIRDPKTHDMDILDIPLTF